MVGPTAPASQSRTRANSTVLNSASQITSSASTATATHHHNHHHHAHHAHTAASNRRLSFGRKPARPAFKRNSSHNKSKRVSIEDPLHHQLDTDSSNSSDTETMAASFLPYCMVCEKQLVNPSPNILYCSQACRRKDTNKPLEPTSPSIGTYGLKNSPHSSPITPSSSYKDLQALVGSGKDILPQRSPTAITPNRFSYTSISSAADMDDIEAGESSDPSCSCGTTRSSRPKLERGDSEAAKYLRQFHSSSLRSEAPSRRYKRPNNCRSHSSNSISLGGTPSLTPSPGTSPASSGLFVTPKERLIERKDSASAASSLHNASSALLMLSTSGGAAPTSVPYGRPLPPRTNPIYSSSHGGAKNISLVMPLAPAASISDHEVAQLIHPESPSSWSATNRKSSLSQQLAVARAGGSSLGGPVTGLGLDLSGLQASLPGLKGRATTATSLYASTDNNSAPSPVDDLKYEKRIMNVAGSAPNPGRSGLKSLFQFEEMQAAPTS